MRGKVGLIYLVYRAPTNKLTKVEDTTSWCFMQTLLVHYLFLFMNCTFGVCKCMKS